MLSENSDQRVHPCCLHEEILHPWLSKICPVKILIRLSSQADLNLCWAHMSKGTFSDVVARLLNVKNLCKKLTDVECDKHVFTVLL